MNPMDDTLFLSDSIYDKLLLNELCPLVQSHPRNDGALN